MVWQISDATIEHLRQTPHMRRVSLNKDFSMPEAARIHDDVIIHFASNTIYTLGNHSHKYWQNGFEKTSMMHGVQIYSGDGTNIITDEAAKTLWIGLCMFCADWRDLAKHAELSDYTSAQSNDSTD